MCFHSMWKMGAVQISYSSSSSTCSRNSRSSSIDLGGHVGRSISLNQLTYVGEHQDIKSEWVYAGASIRISILLAYFTRRTFKAQRGIERGFQTTQPSLIYHLIEFSRGLESREAGGGGMKEASKGEGGEG